MNLFPQEKYKMSMQYFVIDRRLTGTVFATEFEIHGRPNGYSLGNNLDINYIIY